MSSAALKSKNNFFQTGQGILEVIVTIAIGTIMILALVILSVRSNRSSDFSKANSQASTLATEGLEIIRNIKSQNLPNTVNYYGTCRGVLLTNDWISLYSDTDNFDDSTGSHCNLAGYPGIISSLDTTATPIVLNVNNLNPTDTPATTAFDVSFGGRTFKRYVYIADTPTDSSGKSNCNTNDDPSTGDWKTLKQFTVVVSWTDSSGTHQSTQSDCLGPN